MSVHTPRWHRYSGVARTREAVSGVFFQAEDGIRDADVTGVQTCALPISLWEPVAPVAGAVPFFARRENGDPGSTGCAQSESHEQRHQAFVRHDALRFESCRDAPACGPHGAGGIASVYGGGGAGTR